MIIINIWYANELECCQRVKMSRRVMAEWFKWNVCKQTICFPYWTLVYLFTDDFHFIIPLLFSSSTFQKWVWYSFDSYLSKKHFLWSFFLPSFLSELSLNLITARVSFIARQYKTRWNASPNCKAARLSPSYSGRGGADFKAGSIAHWQPSRHMSALLSQMLLNSMASRYSPSSSIISNGTSSFSSVKCTTKKWLT